MLGNKAKSHSTYTRDNLKRINMVGAFKSSIDGLTDASQDNRINNFKLRDVAGSIMNDQRVCKCGKVPTASKVKVNRHKDSSKAHYSGLQTCGSVWVCPVCASKTSEKRRLELSNGTDQWVKMGGEILLVTFTFPHSKGDSLKELLTKQALAFKYFKGRSAYTKHIRSEYEIKGTIKSLETTHSDANGWHPHVHELWFVKRGFSIVKLRKQVYAAWARACEDAGLGRPSIANGVDIKSGDFAANYVAKWGLDYEIAKAHIKKGKSKISKTPFQLLDEYDQGDSRAGALFREYAEAFKGKRQLFWSRGLKDFFGIKQKSDQDLLDEQVEEVVEVLTIGYKDWMHVLRHKAQAYILTLVELRSKHEVYRFINELKNTDPADSHRHAYVQAA
jgi:hypothetical protein